MKENDLNALKAILQRYGPRMSLHEQAVLERAVGLLTADVFTEGALSRTANEVVHVRLRRSRRQRALEQRRAEQLEFLNEDEEAPDGDEA